MSESIKITVSDEGIKIDAEGFKDGACLVEYENLLKHLKSLGISTTEIEQKMKSEAYIGAGSVKNYATIARK